MDWGLVEVPIPYRDVRYSHRSGARYSHSVWSYAPATQYECGTEIGYGTTSASPPRTAPANGSRTGIA
eukprot:191796-Rhodomonas_salina.5